MGMFGRKKDRFEELLQEPVKAEPSPPPPKEAATMAAAPKPKALPPASTGRKVATSVGQGVTLEGTLRFEGGARIEGTFRGRVASGDRLEVGNAATVEANLEVAAVTIQGSVAGNVQATDTVEIQAGGRMKGDIRTPAFQVHRGAFFNGHCDMGDA